MNIYLGDFQTIEPKKQLKQSQFVDNISEEVKLSFVERYVINENDIACRGHFFDNEFTSSIKESSFVDQLTIDQRMEQYHLQALEIFEQLYDKQASAPDDIIHVHGQA